MSKKAALFDLDGTVIDTPAIILSVFEQVMQKQGRALSQDTARQTIGKPLLASFNMLLPNASEQEIEDCISEFRHLFKQEAGRRANDLVFPEWITLAADLKRDDVKIAAVTSKVQASALEVLDQTGITSLFDGIFCNDMVENGKPAPDLTFLALEHLSILPENAIVIGDSIDDISMAKSAGVDCVPVSWGVNSKAGFSTLGVNDAVASWPELKTRLYQLISPQQRPKPIGEM